MLTGVCCYYRDLFLGNIYPVNTKTIVFAQFEVFSLVIRGFCFFYVPRIIKNADTKNMITRVACTSKPQSTESNLGVLVTTQL